MKSDKSIKSGFPVIFKMIFLHSLFFLFLPHISFRFPQNFVQFFFAFCALPMTFFGYFGICPILPHRKMWYTVSTAHTICAGSANKETRASSISYSRKEVSH